MLSPFSAPLPLAADTAAADTEVSASCLSAHGADSLSALPRLLVTDSAGGWRLGGDAALPAPLMRQYAHATAVPPTGRVGEPMPYSLRGDDGVTVALILAFFCFVWVVARSRQFMADWFTNFFHSHRSGTQQVELKLTGKPVLLLHTCLVLGVIAYVALLELFPFSVELFPPAVVLAAPVVVFYAYFVLKLLLYRSVNTVFFNRIVRSRWADTYLMSVLGTGVSLMPLVLLGLYTSISPSWLLLAAMGAFCLCKGLLLMKAFRTFSEFGVSWYHIFLYLCTLEAVPLLLAWAGVRFAVEKIVFIY